MNLHNLSLLILAGINNRASNIFKPTPIYNPICPHLGFFFVYLRPHDNMFTGLGGVRGVILAFSAGDLSRINRGGGVAPDCMDSALKTSFP